MRRRVLGLLMVLLIATSMFAQGQWEDSASKSIVNELPDTKTFTVDPMNPLDCYMDGLYSYDIKMDDGSIRQLKHYYPKDLDYRRQVVFVAQPNGIDAVSFLQASGWMKMADDYDFMLILLEPGEKGWMKNELEYSSKVYDFAQKRYYYTNDDSAYYLVGYGEGADVVLAEATVASDQYAGCAALGAIGDVDFAMTIAKDKETPEPGRMQDSVPLPMWVGAAEKNNGISKVLSYWKQTNNVGDFPSSNLYADEIYEPVQYLNKSRGLTDDNLSKVMVSLGNKDYYDVSFTKYLWSEFLMRAKRQDSYRVGALRYFATPEELGIKRFTGEVDGTMREWYVFVPTSVADGTFSNVPLVFNFHGGGGNGYEFTSRSGWYKMAEDKHFILVMGCGSRTNKWVASTTWAASDLSYFEYVRAEVLKQYPIDATRIYTTGQSMGNMFSTQIAYMRPDLISAASATSGLRFADVSKFNAKYQDVVAPILLSAGVYDGYHLAGPQTEDYKDKWFATWAKRMGFEYNGLNALAHYTNGTFDNLIAKTEAGVPLAQITMADIKIHAVIPEEHEMLYDFMTRYTRDADGTLYYLGEKVVF